MHLPVYAALLCSEKFLVLPSKAPFLKMSKHLQWRKESKTQIHFSFTVYNLVGFHAPVHSSVPVRLARTESGTEAHTDTVGTAGRSALTFCGLWYRLWLRGYDVVQQQRRRSLVFLAVAFDNGFLMSCHTWMARGLLASVNWKPHNRVLHWFDELTC